MGERHDRRHADRPAGGRSAADEAHALRHASPVRTRLAHLLGVHTAERAWRRGATGERVTAWWLGRLPDGWHLFNDIPVGERGANIDHVIVGPPGVFTVNAKNLTGKIWVGARSIRHNGHKTDYLPKSVAEAKRASRLLSSVLGRPVEVRPILAILADGWTVKEEPTDVLVAAPRGVKDWLKRQPATLSPAEVVAIERGGRQALHLALTRSLLCRGSRTRGGCAVVQEAGDTLGPRPSSILPMARDGRSVPGPRG